MGTVFVWRSDRVSEMPFSPGIMTSTIKRSKSSPANLRRASSAFAATETRKPFWTRYCDKRLRMRVSSSITRRWGASSESFVVWSVILPIRIERSLSEESASVERTGFLLLLILGFYVTGQKRLQGYYSSQLISRCVVRLLFYVNFSGKGGRGKKGYSVTNLKKMIMSSPTIRLWLLKLLLSCL